MGDNAAVEFWFQRVPPLRGEDSRLFLPLSALVEDAKAVWLEGVEEELRSTPRSSVTLCKAGSSQSLNPRLTLRESGLQRGDSILVSLLSPPVSQLQRLSVSRRDASAAVCSRLLLPALQELPSLQSLEGFLSKPPSVPLPLLDWLMTQLESSPDLVSILPLVQAEDVTSARALAADFSACLRWLYVPGKEQHTLVAVEALLVQPLLFLDRAAPAEVQLRAVPQRDTSDSTSGMTLSSATGKPLRPDFQLRSSDGRRLLFKGEDKFESLALAVRDLHLKTAHWSPLFYGDLPYLLCYAAAGSSFRFYAIPRGGSQAPWPISPVFDLTRTDDRVRLLCAAVQLHRLLFAVQARLPASVLPADVDLVHTQRTAAGGVAWTRRVRLMGATGRAEKRVTGWGAFCAEFSVVLANVAAAYACPAPQGGLARSRDPPVVKGDTYSVSVVPLGLTGEDARPRDEAELRAAAHGALHGLAALHAAGLVHRDVRLENLGCDASRRRYFLLDLETVAKVDEVPACRLRAWDGDTLDAGAAGDVFGFAGDVRCLGRLLRESSMTFAAGLSPAATAFLAQLGQPEGGVQMNAAASALNASWLCCAGLSCREAGALGES
jgi:hypothetical protein